MSILKAFFDESMHGPRVSVCGFIGRPDQWDIMEVICSEIYSQAGIEYIHMTDFVSPKEPLYASVPMDVRRLVIEALMIAARRYLPLAITIGINRVEFEAALPHRFRSQIGTAYTICGTAAVMLVGSLFQEEGIDWNVVWNFERGHKNKEQLALRLMALNDAAGKEFRIQSFGFSSPAPGVAPEIPLQLADILAFSTVRPERDLGAALALAEEDDERILVCSGVDLRAELIRQAWGPIAELEAAQRKRKDLIRRAEKIVRRIAPYDGATIEDDEMIATIQTNIDRLNKVAEQLKIDSKITLIVKKVD